MSGIPQVQAVLAHIEARESEVAERAGRLRGQIAELTTRLGEFDAESENLQITRKTFHSLRAPAPVDDPPRVEALEHPAYQQILTVLADTGGPMRARDICEALDLPILPKHRGHPVQAETPGTPRHPRRARARLVHPAPPLSTSPPHRAGHLTQTSSRIGHQARTIP
ncbi:hypothetical protein ABZ372_22915 [Streptomyces sp. NPDC005921]|uniref:hypothetical protein n=1 Tax=Streptomyces sp. NPDC005827 TaxID=3157070 RepID=UPI0033CA9BDC